MKNFSVFGFVFLVLLSILSLSPSNAFAEDNNSFSKGITYEEYLEFKNLGFIDEDISFDEIKECQERSLELEKELNESSEFTLVKGNSLRNLQPGDVIITNATRLNGLTGHAAIALSSDQILHIPGFNEPVIVDSRRTFESDYKNGWIKVYRPNDYKDGSRAAGWAERNYKNSGAKYVLTKDFESTDKTYCSKIVLQAYYYGCGINKGKPEGLVWPYDVSFVINNDFRISIGYEGDL